MMEVPARTHHHGHWSLGQDERHVLVYLDETYVVEKEFPHLHDSASFFHNTIVRDVKKKT